MSRAAPEVADVPARRVREAVELLAQLPPRLRQVAFLRAIGFTYQDIADAQGISFTRVNQLLTRADARLYELAAEQRATDRPDAPPRARRLFELEREPPAWLVGCIGRLPRGRESTVSDKLAWRRAAIAIDDYLSPTLWPGSWRCSTVATG